jgi:cytochrome P450/CRP-like cAMP-binding protein
MSTATSGLSEAPLIPGWPIFGNFIQALMDARKFFIDKGVDHGPIYRISLPGSGFGAVTVMSGVDANRFVATKGHEVFTARELFATMVEHIGAEYYPEAIDGEVHAHCRRHTISAFSRVATAPFLDDIVALLDEEVAGFEPGEVRSVSPWLTRVVVKALSIPTLGEAFDDETYAKFETFAYWMLSSCKAKRPMFLLNWPPYKRAKTDMDAMFEAKIDEHAAVPEADRRGDVIDKVLVAPAPDGNPFPKHDQASYAHLPLTNGYIYSGRLAAFLLFALLRHPDVLERVRAEIDEAFADGTPNVNAIARMTTLRNALRETLRYHTILPLCARYAAQDFEFGGYEVKQGSVVFVATVAPHFDEGCFAEPQKWDPDRFAPPRSEHRRQGAFVPYGLGRRACMGIGMNETVVMTTVAVLLRHLDMEITPKDYQLKTAADPVIGPARSCKVKVVGRRTPPETATHTLATDRELETLLRFELAEDKQAELAAAVDVRTYEPGVTVIRQGDPADRFFVISEGQVEVVRERAESDDVRVATLGPGDFFGEQGLLRGAPRNATVRAIGDGPVRLMALDRVFFAHVVGEHDLTSAEIAAVARSRTAANAMLEAFSGIDAAVLTRVGAEGEAVSFEAGHRIIEVGAEPDRMYVVTSGTAEVLSVGVDPFVLARLGPGEMFGEVGLLRRQPRTATVLAGPEGLGALAIDGAGFQKLVEHSAEGDAGLSALVSQRLAELGRPATA